MARPRGGRGEPRRRGRGDDLRTQPALGGRASRTADRRNPAGRERCAPPRALAVAHEHRPPRGGLRHDRLPPRARPRDAPRPDAGRDDRGVASVPPGCLLGPARSLPGSRVARSRGEADGRTRRRPRRRGLRPRAGRHRDLGGPQAVGAGCAALGRRRDPQPGTPSGVAYVAASVAEPVLRVPRDPRRWSPDRSPHRILPRLGRTPPPVSEQPLVEVPGRPQPTQRRTPSTPVRPLPGAGMGALPTPMRLGWSPSPSSSSTPAPGGSGRRGFRVACSSKERAQRFSSEAAFTPARRPKKVASPMQVPLE